MKINENKGPNDSQSQPEKNDRSPRRSKDSNGESFYTARSSCDSWQTYLMRRKMDFVERYDQKYFASNLSIMDFNLMKVVGIGGYGTVVLAKRYPGIGNILADEPYALKIIQKALVFNKNRVQHIFVEKQLLLSIRFPFIVHMEKYFKDITYIYFIMPYVAGGMVFRLLRRMGKFDEKWSVFYAAQVILALEYLHHLGIAYRDLKPENLLIETSGYITLIDLGLAKIIRKRTYTFVGTPDYIAPEVILLEGYDYAVDWWALGVLIYEMCSGEAPFASNDTQETYKFIVNRSFSFPWRLSSPLKDIVGKLLQVNPTRRLGNTSGGVEDIKNHPWFKGIVWKDIFNKQIQAPYQPSVQNKWDSSNYSDCGALLLSHTDRDLFSTEFEDF